MAGSLLDLRAMQRPREECFVMVERPLALPRPH